MIKNIEELPIAGKRVFMRLDFNVPIKDGVVTDDTRIREALPTIKYAIGKGAKVILASHLGRPEGHDMSFSLEPVATHLSELLGTEVLLTDDCVGDGIEMMVKHLKSAQVILLENLRFHREEEKNDVEFAKQLAALADVYVTDAFGTAHRKHASTYGVPTLMQVKGCGYLIQKELKFLGRLLDNPAHPYVAVLGGSKVADKMKTIEHLFLQVDAMLIGGAMGNTFRVAQGNWQVPAGGKQPKAEEVELAKSLIQKAAKHEVNLLLPVDDNQGFDIGSKTIALFEKEIATAKTVFWNGPVGMFEKPEFATGTFAVARAMAGNKKALRIVGGGDSVSAVNAAGVAPDMDHISTGGGASLEFLEGDGLPGIQILESYDKRVQPAPLQATD